ncbi:MAG: pentapeptide repeat-containing protein [Chloroflexi bacterium]|nr:pentapeptide repeat-containing protein [Chloroflexota bacterium]
MRELKEPQEFQFEGHSVREILDESTPLKPVSLKGADLAGINLRNANLADANL